MCVLLVHLVRTAQKHAHAQMELNVPTQMGSVHVPMAGKVRTVVIVLVQKRCGDRTVTRRASVPPKTLNPAIHGLVSATVSQDGAAKTVADSVLS